jgi:nitrate reductase gamma subunit
MNSWLEWARGPFFWASLTFMILGLLRHSILTIVDIRRVARRAGDKNIPYRKITTVTLAWLFPITKLGNRLIFGLTSLLFHIAVILVPIFLAGHVVLWQRGTGVAWPSIPNLVADILTAAGIITAVMLIIQRATARPTRALSRFQDYAIPLYILVPFITGFLVKHPAMNPFAYGDTMLVHVMSANILFILIPLTKLSHMVLLPGTQLVSEVAWHWPKDAGSKVGTALGKEGEAI